MLEIQHKRVVLLDNNVTGLSYLGTKTQVENQLLLYNGWEGKQIFRSTNLNSESPCTNGSFAFCFE